MNPLTPDEDRATIAALYAAGALPPAPAADFEALLDAGDPAALAAWSEHAPFLTAALEAVVPVTPDPATRRTLLASLTDETQGAAQSPWPPTETAFFVQRGAAADWQPTGVPGVELRTLFEDPTRAARSILLRMAPGACFPSHPHPGVEECYIIEGAVEIGGVVYVAGDYMRASAGTDHEPTHSPHGCLMLLTMAG